MAKADKRTAVQDPCNDGLPELTPLNVLVTGASTVRVRVALCGSPANLVVHLDGAPVLHQQINGPFAGAISVPSAPGDHLLLWSVAPTAKPWRIQTEVHVDDGVFFRIRKTDGSASPLPKFAAVLRVR